MRKNDRFDQGLTATGAVRRAKVFGIKSMTVVMTAAMLLSGVPTTAIAEELQEAGVIATDSTDQGASSDQQATDQSNTQDQSSSQQDSQSGSQDNAAATQNSSQSAQPAQQATTADIALTLNNASITYKGQVIAQPAQKVTASTSDNFQFTVQPDNGYKLNKVKLTLNGSDRELKADANGLYTVSAADVAQFPRITFETEQEENGETAEQATPIEDSRAVAVQSEDGARGPQVTVELGDTFTVTASKGSSWEWYAWRPFTLVSGQSEKTITVSAMDPSWAFDGDYKDYEFSYRYDTDKQASETVRLYKRTFNVSAAPTFDADGDHYWVPVLTDSKTGKEIPVNNGKIEIQYWKNGAKIANQYDRDALDKRPKFCGAGDYEVRIVVNEGWIYRAGTTVIDPSKPSNSKTIDADSPSDYLYDGKTHKWSPKVTDESGAEVPKSGYTITYKRNGKKTMDFTSTGTITVTITGKGKYSGTIERAYCIYDYDIAGKDKIKVGEKATYTASGFTGDVTWSSSDSGILSIDPATGEATGVYPGTVTIHAVDKDGHACSKEVKVVEDSSKGAWVYLYTKVIYNGKSLSDSGTAAKEKCKELGLTVNKDGWFTLGKLWVNDIDTASSSNTGRSDGMHGDSKIARFRSSAIAALPRTIRYATANGGINLIDVNWGYMTNVSSGATNYVGSGYTWHLDGEVDINTMSKVTVHYVELGNKTNELHKAVEVASQVGSTFDPKNEAVLIKGYELAQADPAISVDESGKQEVYLYYSKGSYPYTVKYIDKDTNEELHDPNTVHGVYGETVKVNALKFQGYNVDAEEKSLTVGDGDNTVIFYYTKKSINYTVKYVWSGKEIAEASTGSLKLGESVTAEAKTIDGYTIVPDQKLTKTALDDDITITVKYYKNVTLTAKSDKRTYNGKAQELEGYISSEDAAKFDDITAKGSGKDAGEYPVKFEKNYKGTVSKDAKYIVSETVLGKLTISPVTDEVTITVKGHTGGEKYNGKEQTVSGYEISGLPAGVSESDVVYGGTAVAKGANAGTYKMNLDSAKFSLKESAAKNYTNVKFAVTDGELKIAKRNVTLTADSDQKVYDGTPLTKDSVTVGDDGFAEGEGATYKVSGSQTSVGESTNALVTYTLNESTKADNYNITTANGKLEVTPVTDAVTVTVEGHHNTVTYNGSEQSVAGYDVTIEGSILYKDADFTFDGNAEAKGIDAAKAVIPMGLTTANFKNISNNFTNVTFRVNDGWIKIDPIKIELTARGATKPYDGTSLTNNTVDITAGAFVEGQGVTCTATGSQTDVGNSDNEFSYTFNEGTKSGNYTITKKSEKLVVSPSDKEVVVVISENGGTATYDGNEHEATGYTVKSISNNLYSEKDFTFDGNAEVKATGAGSHDMNLKAGDFHNTSKRFKNVTFVIEKHPLVINKKDVTIVTPDAAKVYDGTPLTAAGAIEGLVKGETVDFKTTGAQTEQGASANSYKLEWTGSAKKSNYRIVSENIGTLTVTKQAIDPKDDDNYKGVTVGNLKDVKYNGEDQKQKPIVKSGNTALLEGRDYELKYSEDTVNAGKVTVTVEGVGNYSGKVTRTYNITKRQIVLGSNTRSKVYDGTALTDDEVIEAGADTFVTGEASNIRATGSVINPGSVENAITFNKGEKFNENNYDIAYKTGKLTVTAKDVASKDMTVKAPSDTIYNGGEQKFEPVVMDGAKKLVKDADYELSYSDDVTNAGTVTITVTGKGNYAGTTTVSYKINPRPVTLVSNGHTKDYDGTALEDGEVVVTSEYDFVKDEVSDLKANGSITEPGETINNITYSKGDSYKDSNYKVTITEGKLKVLPRSLNASGMDVSKLDNVVYNGADQEQAPEVTDSKTGKTLVAGTDYDLAYSKDTKNVGTVTVTITGKGNYTGTVEREYNIECAPLTVVTGSASRSSNGCELTAPGELQGLVAGETADFATTGKQKSVGSSLNTYNIEWNGTAKKGNYRIASEQFGTLTITESAQTIVVVTTGGRVEYDGTTHSPTVEVKNLPEGYSVRDASSNAAVKDVNARKDGDQGVKVTADNLAIVNAEGEDVTSKLKIEKVDGYLAVTPRTVTVTTPSGSKVYDGTALTAAGSISNLVDGETVDFKTTGSQTEVGGEDKNNTYELTWNGSAKKYNYKVKENLGTLKVTKQSINKDDEDSYKGIEIDAPKSVKYDGSKHQWTPSVTDTEGNTLAAGKDYKVTYKRDDASTDDFKNAGTITVTIEGVGNYSGTVTKEYKITKRDVTLTSAGNEWTYDGKEHREENVTVSGDGFAEGEGVDYSNFATVRDVTAEAVKNAFDYAAKKGTDLERNYNVTVVNGELKVKKQQADGNIVLTTKDAQKTYDGHALEAGEATATVTTGDDVKIEYSLDHETWTKDRSDVTLTDAGGKTVYVRASSKKNYSGYVEATETMTVDPATLTIVTKGGEKTYDGAALTAGGSISGLVNGETAKFEVTGSQTIVGATMNAYALTWNGTAKASNYTVKETLGKLKVNPRSITDEDYGMSVSSPKNVAYDGVEHKWTPVVKDGEKTLVAGTDYTVAYDKDDFTNVTGTITVTITGKGNYNGSVTRTYQITPAQLTVETKGASKIYDGEALTNDVATIKGLKNGESETIHATGTQTEVGESNNTYVITWDGTAKESNYAVKTETLGKLVVNENAEQITATPLNVETTYDGQPHGTTVQVEGLPKGYRLEKAASDATATNVDDNVTAKVDELVIVNAQGKDVTSKLNIKRGTATIKINPAQLTVTTAGDEKEYDGTALTASGITVEGLKGNDKVAAKTTGSRTKVGTTDNTYSIDWTGAKKSNYTVVDTFGQLKVTPSTKDVTLTSGSASRVYNGHALTADKISAEGLPAGFKVKATMTGTQTDAGSSENTVESYKILDAKGDDVTDMFTNVTVKAGKLEVTPKEITVETEGATKAYDGRALTNKKGTIHGLVSGEHADVVTNGTQTTVGSSDNGYTIAWGSAKEGNYTIASDTLGKLVVTPQSVNPNDPSYRNLTVNDPKDVTYDGLSHQWAPEVKDADGTVLAEGTDYTLTYDTDDFTDAGTVTVTITGMGNYTGTVSKSYRIKPAPVSIKTESASRVYNGRALTAGGAISGLVNGETVDFRVTGSQTKVGSSKNSYTLAWNGTAREANYSIVSTEVGTLTVIESKDTVVVTTTGGTFTYDGQPHGATVTVSELPEGYTVDGTPSSDATATDANGDGVKATVDHLVIRNAEGKDVTSKLDIKKVDGTIKVLPAELAVKTDSASKVYDGEALTAGASKINLVNGEEATLKATGEQTEVGSSSNTYKLTFDKTAKAKNYKVVSEDLGTLTVKPQSITPGTDDEPSDSYKGVTVDDPEDSIYDGAEHKWMPVVKDTDGNELKEGVDYEVTYGTDDFADVATINATITGKGNYAGAVTKSYRITKAPLHIVTGSATKTFDGTALTNAAVTVDGLAQTDRIGVTVTGQQTGVGSSQNTYTIDWMQVNENNYELTDELGTLTVTPVPATPQNPVTPGTTPTTPGATPGTAGGNNVVNTVATALANGYNAVTGNNQGAAASEEQIFDAKNPLGKFDGQKDTCWVHWYMIVCGIVTAVYGLFVGLRRNKHSRRLEEDLNKVLGDDDESQE